jgi:hypothetical protein
MLFLNAGRSKLRGRSRAPPPSRGRPMSQDSRNYYDDQFNDRINQIAKPGAAPPRSSGSGSSGGGWGLKGGLGGGAVVVFIVIRLVIAAARVGSSSSTPTYYQSPPTYQPSPIIFPEHQFDPDRGAMQKDGDRFNDEDNARLMELLRQLREKQEPAADPDKAGRDLGAPPLGVPKDKVPPADEKK